MARAPVKKAAAKRATARKPSAKPILVRNPYRAYRFRVQWDGTYVAGISKVSALRETTEVIEVRQGGDPNKTQHMPGRTLFEPITLERGITHDTAFAAWADQVRGGGTTLGNFRKDIAIELTSPAGTVLRRYLVHRCWVSAYQALPALDAASNAVLIESITLQHEGWALDPSVP
jgi:phage tail-like protein